MNGTRPYKRKKSKVVIFNKKELKKFLKIASKQNWYLETMLGLFCGLRKGEILGLKFSDFDMEKQTVTVCRQLSSDVKLGKDMEKTGFVIEDYTLKTKDPKTINSYRIMRIPKVIIEELKNRKEYLKELEKRKPGFVSQDYISCQENGNPHSLSAFNTYLTKVCIRNDLPKITVHSLRHMFATILLERGVSIPRISALLGHSSVHTTFEFYCEVMEENEKIKTFMNKTFESEKC